MKTYSTLEETPLDVTASTARRNFLCRLKNKVKRITQEKKMNLDVLKASLNCAFHSLTTKQRLTLGEDCELILEESDNVG